MHKHMLMATGNIGGTIDVFGDRLPEALVFTDSFDGSQIVYVRWSHG